MLIQRYTKGRKNIKKNNPSLQSMSILSSSKLLRGPKLVSKLSKTASTIYENCLHIMIAPLKIFLLSKNTANKSNRMSEKSCMILKISAGHKIPYILCTAISLSIMHIFLGRESSCRYLNHDSWTLAHWFESFGGWQNRP